MSVSATENSVTVNKFTLFTKLAFWNTPTDPVEANTLRYVNTLSRFLNILFLVQNIVAEMMVRN